MTTDLPPRTVPRPRSLRRLCGAARPPGEVRPRKRGRAAEVRRIPGGPNEELPPGRRHQRPRLQPPAAPKSRRRMRGGGRGIRAGRGSAAADPDPTGGGGAAAVDASRLDSNVRPPAGCEFRKGASVFDPPEEIAAGHPFRMSSYTSS